MEEGMEEQNYFVNDSEMGNPSILSVLIYFANSYFNVYFALYVFMIEWRINKQTNKQYTPALGHSIPLFQGSLFSGTHCILVIVILRDR